MNQVNALPPPTPPPRQVRPVANEIDIFDYIGVIMRRWKVVVLTLCIIFAIVAFDTFTMKPVYQATSSIRLMESHEDSLSRMTEGNWTDPVQRMNTEIATMKSRSIAERVVERLHLNWQVSQKSEGFFFKIVEFMSTAKNPVYSIKMISSDTYEVRDQNGQAVGQGKAGVFVSNNGFNLLLNDIKGKTGDTCQLALVPLQDVAMQVQGEFNATEYGKQSDIILASYNSTDPVQARDMVNAFVKAYMDNAVELRSEQTRKTLAFIENQLKTLRGDLDASENKLQSYKSSAGLMDLGNKASSLVTTISELEKSLLELEAKKSEMLATYTPTHRAVKAIQQQIVTVQKKLNAYKKEIKNLPIVEQDMASLGRVSKVNAESYTFLLQKREEARIAMESTISNLSIVDAAIIPEWPIKPNIQRNLLVALLAGLALGILLAFLLEYLDDTIKDADQAKRAIGLNLLATIPLISGQTTKKENLSGPAAAPQITADETNLTKDIVPVNNVLVTKEEPKSIASEAFRALRTSLHFSAISKDKKILVFTSTFPKEGKSVISSNTAVVTAQTGARVLLIDCDLRRSSLHSKFNFGKTPGLTEVLTRDVTFEQAVHKTTMPGLDLLCAGTTPPNPSELLGSEEMRHLLLSQRENYDYVIIDAPPVLAVTDAPVLTTVSDLVILVMEAGRVPIKAAQHMREILSRLNAPIAGIVMNDKTGKGERYTYYNRSYYGKAYGYRHGYGYGYSYGYGYYSDEAPRHKRKGTRWNKILSRLSDKIRKKE